MKKFLIFIILVASVKGYTQGPGFYQADRITANKALWLGNMRMDSISNDSNLTSCSANKLSTQKAVKKYVDNTFLKTSSATGLYVPLTRTITINGTAYDLSSNRSWSVGDLTAATAATTYFPLTGGSLTGTGGNGFHGFTTQSAAPATPSTGFRLYADATNRFSWKGANGFVRTFDGTTNTANRNYVLPDSSGTFPLLGSSQTFTGLNSFTNNLNVNSNSVNGLGSLKGNQYSTGYQNTISYSFSNILAGVVGTSGYANTAMTIPTLSGATYGGIFGTYSDQGGSPAVAGLFYGRGISESAYGLSVSAIGQTYDISGKSVYGIYINSVSSGYQHNYGLYINSVINGSNNWGIYQNGGTKNYFSGNVLVGTTTDAGYKIDASGTIRADKFQLSALNTAPATSTSTGTTGEIRIVNGFIYVCVATNTWQRSTLSTF